MNQDLDHRANAQAGPLTIGGIPLEQGAYLSANADRTTTQKPGKDTGYAFFDGKVLTLHNFEYSGEGLLCGEDSIGLCVPAGTLTIRMEGENSICVDAVTRGIGISVPQDAHLVIGGRGSLTINARNGIAGNCGIYGDGSVEIKSGTLRVSAGLAEYTLVNGKKQYLGSSYALRVREFTDHHARIQGHDKRGSLVNLNNSQQVIYDFPKAALLLPMLLAGVSLVCVGVTVWTLFFRQPVVLTPDFAPVEKEQYAESIPGDTDSGKLDQPSGGGAIALTYSMEVSVDLAANRAYLYVANPSRSNKDLVLQVMIQDTIIAQSGTVSPGNQVQELELAAGMGKRLSPGGYEGVIHILSYEPDTGEMTVLDTNIAVTITVA